MPKIVIARALAGAFIMAVASCAETSVTPISQNQFLLSTSAPPHCGRTGASDVASKMAAVETIRRGYPRFVVLGASSANNVSMVTTGPTYANTYSNYSGFGNSITGTSRTTYGGSYVIPTGSHDADLRVLMLKQGDPGFQDGVDAKQMLSPEWPKMVENGVTDC